MVTAPEEILDFWFAGVARDPVKAKERNEFWFGTSSKTDEIVRQRFSSAILPAAAGELNGWLTQARSTLALVILLDQFPRNIWRGKAEAFAYDGQALQAAQYGVNSGYLSQLSPIERAFLLLPYQHSESLGDQRESVRLYEEVIRSAAPEWGALLEENPSYARQHLEIIERFGRFPHRNKLLDRTSSAEEIEFLQAGGPTFGQSMVR